MVSTLVHASFITAIKIGFFMVIYSCVLSLKTLSFLGRIVLCFSSDILRVVTYMWRYSSYDIDIGIRYNTDTQCYFLEKSRKHSMT